MQITDAGRGRLRTSPLLSSALAAALLIAPSMYHRLNFRRGGKRQGADARSTANKLRRSSAPLLTGLGVACAVYLVADVAFGGSAAAVATVGVPDHRTAIALDSALPLVRRRCDAEDTERIDLRRRAPCCTAAAELAVMTDGALSIRHADSGWSSLRVALGRQVRFACCNRGASPSRADGGVCRLRQCPRTSAHRPSMFTG